MSHSIYLKAKSAGPSIGMHPWLFEGAIESVDKEIKAGDWVDVRKSEDKSFIARGLYNPKSGIRTRLYTWKESESDGNALIKKLILQAWNLRTKDLAMSPAQSFRWIFSEGDYLSGLVVDKFGDYLSIQFSSSALFERKDLILEELRKIAKPKGIRVRPDRTTAQAEGFEFDEFWMGEEPTGPFQIDESGMKIWVDLRKGQKTGYYLDQKLNRLAAAQYAPGRRVLDLFCYSGGFGLQAAKHGAKEVLGVDSSEAAIALAHKNVETNGLKGITFQESEVDDVLREQSHGSWDMIVLDPPRLAAQRKAVDGALRKYFFLNEESMKRLKPGGIFVTSSCSGSVNLGDFMTTLAGAARRLKRGLQILDVRGASPDHPVLISCPETAYLKCVIARID